MNQENENIIQTTNDSQSENITPITSEETLNTINEVQVNNDTSIDQEIQIKNELQNIPTVEQDAQEFINKVQAQSQEKKDDKKDGINFVFIILLFAVILAIVIFLFPVLLNYV